MPFIPPYESIYSHEQQMNGTRAERAREIYRQGGFQPSAEEMADHVSVELDCLAHLLGKQGSGEGAEGLASRLLFDHLVRWAGKFCADVEELSGSEFYRGRPWSFGACCRWKRKGELDGFGEAEGCEKGCVLQEARGGEDEAPKRAVSGRKRAQRIPPVEAGKQAARRELLTGTVFPLTPALPAADAVSTIPLSARQEMVSEMTAEFRRDILVDAARCNGVPGLRRGMQEGDRPQHKKWKTPVVPRIEIRLVDGVFVPLLCRNCEEAPCMVYCLTGCRARDTSGWVVTDYDRCVGCWMCVMSCPFGAITPVYRRRSPGNATGARTATSRRASRCAGRAPSSSRGRRRSRSARGGRRPIGSPATGWQGSQSSSHRGPGLKSQPTEKGYHNQGR